MRLLLRLALLCCALLAAPSVANAHEGPHEGVVHSASAETHRGTHSVSPLSCPGGSGHCCCIDVVNFGNGTARVAAAALAFILVPLQPLFREAPGAAADALPALAIFLSSLAPRAPPVLL